jgi:DNA-binding CsgD family transcriptional regulator
MIDTDTKVPAGKSYTYENVLRIWAGSVQSTETAQENQLGQNLQDSLLEYGPAALYLANLQTLRYLYVSKNIERLSGYSPAEFMEKGPGFAYLLMHPEDRPHILEHVHKRRLAFLGSLPAGAYKNYKFTYNYRFRKRNGTYIQLLNQEVVLQADAQGNPLLLTGMATDVSALEEDISIRLSVTHFARDGEDVPTIRLYQSRPRTVSLRELEVLRLLAAGRTTGQIAKVLCISPHTVKNHRKNMFARTGARNMAELVRLAYAEGLFNYATA